MTRIVRAAAFIVGAELLLTLLGAASASSQANNDKFIIDPNRVLAFDTVTEPIGPYMSAISQGSQAIRWTQPVVAPANVNEMSIHFRIISGVKLPAWELRIKVHNVVIDEIKSDSARGMATETWSADITGNSAIVELVAGVAPKGLRVAIDMYDHPIEPLIPQAIIGKNDLQSISSSPDNVRKLGSAIARLRIKTTRGEALCTAFLISESLLITNFHCVSTGTEAANTKADFGYDVAGQEPHTFKLEKLVVMNSDLAYDYVVARVSGNPGIIYNHVVMPKLGSMSLPVDAPPLGSITFGTNAKELFVIEHPGGGPKMVSIMDCSVVYDKVAGADGQELSDFGHQCDTLGGSSGSPVFDAATGELVGLHHLGSTSGSKPSDPLENQAVYIGYIIEDIKKQAPNVLAEIVGKGSK